MSHTDHHNGVRAPSSIELRLSNRLLSLSSGLFLSSSSSSSQRKSRCFSSNRKLFTSPFRIATILSIGLCLFGVPQSSAIDTSALNDMFSLKNLAEYNLLIDCVSKIRSQFMQCNVEAQRKGEAVLRYVDEKSEIGTLLKCCGVWLVRDCWLAAAKAGNCSAEQMSQLSEMPTKMMPGLGTVCHQYPAGSLRCYAPQIVLGAVLLSAILLLILVVLAAICAARYCRRRRYRSDRRRSGSLPIEVTDQESLKAEKVKLTSNKNNNNNNEKNISTPTTKTTTTKTAKSKNKYSDKTENNINNNNFEYIDSEKGN